MGPARQLFLNPLLLRLLGGFPQFVHTTNYPIFATLCF